MNSDAWYQLSMWLLRFGFLFLIAFGVCAVKFDLVSMIQSEINERKNRRFLDNESYFAYVEEKNKENGEESPSFQMEDIPSPELPSPKPPSLEIPSATTVSSRTVKETPSSATVVSSRTVKEAPSSATVVSSRTVKEAPSSATVVTRRTSKETPSPVAVVTQPSPEKQETSAEFILLENIMVIHGNPELIHKSGV